MQWVFYFVSVLKFERLPQYNSFGVTYTCTDVLQKKVYVKIRFFFVVKMDTCLTKRQFLNT